MSTLMLQMKALEVAREQGLCQEKFKASRDWCASFRGKHGLSVRMRTRQSQDQDGERKVARNYFAAKVKALMLEHGIDKVYNADQTGIFYEFLPRTTVQGTGSKMVWIRCSGKDKERATAMLLVDSYGNKPSLFLVSKQKKLSVKETVLQNLSVRNGFGKTVCKEIDVLMNEHDCVVHGNPSAWWNGDRSLSFLKFHFGCRANMDAKVLLLWDAFSGHWTEEVTEYAASINVVLVKYRQGSRGSANPLMPLGIRRL